MLVVCVWWGVCDVCVVGCVCLWWDMCGEGVCVLVVVCVCGRAYGYVCVVCW